MRAIISIVLALSAVPAAARQDGLGEDLRSPALPGFVVGYRAGNDKQFIQEEVPKGETVNSWTRMVTTQRFRDLALGSTPLRLLQNIAGNAPNSCPGAILAAPESLAVGGRPAAQMRIDCPLNPQSGTPETFMILAVSGKRDIMLKQVAFRRRPSRQDIAWATDFLNGVSFCTSNAPASCKR